MSMDELYLLMKGASTASCNMTTNTVIIDGVCHTLYGAVLHSNWNEFNPTGIESSFITEQLMHNQKFVDKENKISIDVDHRMNIKYLDVDQIKSITIEYNKDNFKYL